MQMDASNLSAGKGRSTQVSHSYQKGLLWRLKTQTDCWVQ